VVGGVSGVMEEGGVKSMALYIGFIYYIEAVLVA
jgi:hypothetical protein